MPSRRHQQRNLHEPPALPQRRHGCLNTDAALRYEAARHGCALFDVHRDGACQFHALKHACTYQLRPARAVEYDATGMRDAILDALADDELLNRFWVGESDADAVQAGSLRTKLEENVRAEYGCTLRAWFRRLRKHDEWGDGNTLIGSRSGRSTRPPSCR